MERFPRTVQGSVISGTMRPEDLIPAFLRELGGVRHDRPGLYADIERRMAHGDAYWDSEDAAFDLATLFDVLDEYAPIGLYFGAHPGDGSDYGFWPVEEDEEDEGDEE